MKKNQLILIFLVFTIINSDINSKFINNLETYTFFRARESVKNKDTEIKQEPEKQGNQELTGKANKIKRKKSFFFTKKFLVSFVSLVAAATFYIAYKVSNSSFNKNYKNLGLIRPLSRIFKPVDLGINLQNDPVFSQNIDLEDIKMKCGENKKLAQKFESLNNASKGSYEVIDILKDLVVNKKNLPENNIFLMEAEKIFTRKHIFPALKQSDFEGFSDDDKDLVFSCFYLLSMLKSKKEEAFQFIAKEDLNYTPEKIHNKNQKRRISSIFQINN